MPTNLLYPIVGDSDVGDSDDGDIEMMVIDLRCWWRWYHYVVDFFRYVSDTLTIKLVTNILNRSSTSQPCHQHIWSQTSVTNTHVTSE